MVLCELEKKLLVFNLIIGMTNSLNYFSGTLDLSGEENVNGVKQKRFERNGSVKSVNCSCAASIDFSN